MRTRTICGLQNGLAALLALAFLPVCGGNNTYNPSLVGGTAGPGPSFSLAVAPATVTVNQGGQATYTATLTASNGFSSPVTLTVSGAPAGVTASFNPATVTPTSAGAASTLTVT